MAMELSNVPLPQETMVDTPQTVMETEAPPISNMVEEVGMEEPVADFSPSQDMADVTMARIYETKNEGTKEEQLFQSANQYIDELFSLGNSMPELSGMTDAQRVLENMYQIESEQPLEYNPKGEMTRELVDTLNGRLEGKKQVVAEMRQKMITPQLDIVSIPEAATKEQIMEIQKKVGAQPDGIMGPDTEASIRMYNKLQQEEALDQRTTIDPETGLESEVATQADIDAPMGNDRFLKHLNVREGSEEASYKDSLGKMTGGVGHLMTDAEQAKYPLGTKIPKDVRDTWLKEDSAKALSAATKQADELGITDRKFIEALGSVNFQLGTKWNTIHKKTWELIKKGDYKAAAKEAANSKWNAQTPTRVRDFQKALEQLNN